MLVAMEAMDRPVMNVMAVAPPKIAKAFHRPAKPTTVLNRRNMITPRIVSRLGVNTPPKVPKRRDVMAFVWSGMRSGPARGVQVIGSIARRARTRRRERTAFLLVRGGGNGVEPPADFRKPEVVGR